MRSKFEENVAKLLTKNKVKFKYEPHALNYVLERNYWPDFKIGSIYVETKGRFSSRRSY